MSVAHVARSLQSRVLASERVVVRVAHVARLSRVGHAQVNVLLYVCPTLESRATTGRKWRKWRKWKSRGCPHGSVFPYQQDIRRGRRLDKLQTLCGAQDADRRGQRVGLGGAGGADRNAREHLGRAARAGIQQVIVAKIGAEGGGIVAGGGQAPAGQRGDRHKRIDSPWVLDTHPLGLVVRPPAQGADLAGVDQGVSDAAGLQQGVNLVGGETLGNPIERDGCAPTAQLDPLRRGLDALPIDQRTGPLDFLRGRGQLASALGPAVHLPQGLHRDIKRATGLL